MAHVEPGDAKECIDKPVTNLIAHQQAKQAQPELLILVRVGDGYDTFGTDSETIAQVCGLRLVKHKTGSPMVMIQEDELETCLRQLLVAGHRVAICEKTDVVPQSASVERLVDEPSPLSPQSSLFD